MAADVNGETKEMNFVPKATVRSVFLTFNDEMAEKAYRHTASHVLAQAIKRLYPNTKLAIGPAIEDGYYYDFEFETPITTGDFEKNRS